MGFRSLIADGRTVVELLSYGFMRWSSHSLDNEAVRRPSFGGGYSCTSQGYSESKDDGEDHAVDSHRVAIDSTLTCGLLCEPLEDNVAPLLIRSHTQIDSKTDEGTPQRIARHLFEMSDVRRVHASGICKL